MAFSATDRPGIRPSPARSSETNPTPPLTRPRGPAGGGVPPTVTRPDRTASSPYTARTNSVRPAPTSPAIPRISPRRTSKETPAGTPPAPVSPSIFRRASPAACGTCGNNSSTLRPTINATN